MHVSTIVNNRATVKTMSGLSGERGRRDPGNEGGNIGKGMGDVRCSRRNGGVRTVVGDEDRMEARCPRPSHVCERVIAHMHRLMGGDAEGGEGAGEDGAVRLARPGAGRR